MKLKFALHLKKFAKKRKSKVKNQLHDGITDMNLDVVSRNQSAVVHDDGTAVISTVEASSNNVKIAAASATTSTASGDVHMQALQISTGEDQYESLSVSVDHDGSMDVLLVHDVQSPTIRLNLGINCPPNTPQTITSPKRMLVLPANRIEPIDTSADVSINKIPSPKSFYSCKSANRYKRKQPNEHVQTTTVSLVVESHEHDVWETPSLDSTLSKQFISPRSRFIAEENQRNFSSIIFANIRDAEMKQSRIKSTRKLTIPRSPKLQSSNRYERRAEFNKIAEEKRKMKEMEAERIMEAKIQKEISEMNALMNGNVKANPIRKYSDLKIVRPRRKLQNEQVPIYTRQMAHKREKDLKLQLMRDTYLKRLMSSQNVSHSLRRGRN